MSTPSRFPSLLAFSFCAALLVPALSACSFQIGSSATMPADEFASKVAGVVASQFDLPTPIVDCGEAPVSIVEGAVVHCDFSAEDDPATHYDSTTTISNVQSSGDFHIDTKIDDHPKGG